MRVGGKIFHLKKVEYFDINSSVTFFCSGILVMADSWSCWAAGRMMEGAKTSAKFLESILLNAFI